MHPRQTSWSQVIARYALVAGLTVGVTCLAAGFATQPDTPGERIAVLETEVTTLKNQLSRLENFALGIIAVVVANLVVSALGMRQKK